MDLTTKIKTALKAAGLNEELAKYIKVDEESQIEEAVTKLKTTLEMSNDDFIKALEESGLGANFERYLKSETDRRVTEAIKTHDLKTQKEEEDRKKKDEKDKKKKEIQGDPDMTPEQKTLAELTNNMSKLTDIVTGLVTERKQVSIQETVKEALKKAGLSENFAKMIKTEDVDKVETEVNELKDSLLEFKQSEIDKAIKDGTLTPQQGGASSTIEEDMAKKFAEEKNEGKSDGTFSGKPIPGVTDNANKE